MSESETNQSGIQTSPTEGKPVATKPAPKPVAKKPAAKKPTTEERRGFMEIFGFLSWVSVGWITFTISALAGLLGTLRFLIPNVLAEEPSKFKAGSPEDYEDGKVVERYKSKNAWIVRKDGVIYALSTTCTHLGCTPNWLERDQKFKCPCHGSGFHVTGVNFEGPAPRPLERWAVSLGEDGQIVVDKSKKFQEERGEWDNPESYIKV